jgi:hypothetical protein
MRRSLIAVFLVVFLSGCFEIEQSINLQKDLSGTADFHLGVDMEPMIVVMAQVGREMQGKTGPITAAELAKAKADFKKSKTSKKTTTTPEMSRAEMQKEMSKELPKGVKVLDFNATERDFGIATDIKFGFEKLGQLVGVKMPSKKESADPTDRSIIDAPFEGLEVVEKGDTVTIRTKPTNPAEKVNEQAAEAPKMDAATEKLIKDAFGKMRVVYRITAPFTVVSHNATRKEGNTLIWVYDMERFEKMAKSKKLDDLGVKVTYKR